jgi:hypothetical protein
MKDPNRPAFSLSIVAAFAMLIAFGIPISGQEVSLQRENSATKQAPALDDILRHNIEDWIQQGRGMPDDWSHRHLVFSNPGTEEDAIANGTHDGWLNVINDPRYILQSLKRDAGVTVRPEESLGIEQATAREKSKIKRDWSMDLGSGATVGAGQYPAKYSFNPIGTPSCMTDYVAFNTSLAGGSSQPTIIAYNNIYKGANPGCGTTGVPTIYWQYNTAYPYVSGGGGAADNSKIVTSVVLSSDGSQLAFIESNTSNVASLVILKWVASSSLVQMNSASNNVTPASYRSCIAPCMTRITLSGSPNDTNSAPFVDYNNSALYVGDNNGVLHKFTGVFSGTPAEINGGGTSSGWPVTMTSGNILTSPILDLATSQAFVGDSGGFLYSEPTGGSNTGGGSSNKVKSAQVGYGLGIVDAPIVDSTTGTVYAFTGDDNSTTCGTSQPCTAVLQFAANFANGNAGSKSVSGVGGSTIKLYAGAFNNAFYSNTGTTPTGDLYLCAFTASPSGAARLYYLPFSSGTLASIATAGPILTNGAAGCSPVNEILDSAGTEDMIFFGVTANVNITFTGSNTCSGACVLSFNINSVPTTTTKAQDGLSSASGSGGIIIDNVSAETGASQIYFTPLGNGTCVGNGTTGNGTGGCAVQASQAGLQ